MIAVAPFLIQTSLERVISALQIVSAEKPAYASGIPLFSYAFPLYRGLIFIGGITLLWLAHPIYQGKEWTYPTGLLAAAFPSAGGMFMFMPYVSFVDGFPVPMAISIVGLIFFWSLILMRKADKWLKWGQFLALTSRDADHTRFHRRHRQPADAVDSSRKTNVRRAGNMGACLVSTNTMDLCDPALHCHIYDRRP